MNLFCLLMPGAMERIGQSDVATILGRLHQELKSQTRDSKAPSCDAVLTHS